MKENESIGEKLSKTIREVVIKNGDADGEGNVSLLGQRKVTALMGLAATGVLEPETGIVEEILSAKNLEEVNNLCEPHRI